MTLCESKTSSGPALVSLAEKAYCDMKTPKTLPLCTQDDVSTDCFGVESKQEIKQNGQVIPKDYTGITAGDCTTTCYYSWSSVRDVVEEVGSFGLPYIPS